MRRRQWNRGGKVSLVSEHSAAHLGDGAAARTSNQNDGVIFRNQIIRFADRSTSEGSTIVRLCGRLVSRQSEPWPM
jgi:hypothetical protein